MTNLCIKTPSSASLVLIFQLLVLRPRPNGYVGIKILGQSPKDIKDLQDLLSQNRPKVSTHCHLEVCGRCFWGEKTGLAIDYRQVGPALRGGGDKVKCDVSRSGK